MGKGLSQAPGQGVFTIWVHKLEDSRIMFRHTHQQEVPKPQTHPKQVYLAIHVDNAHRKHQNQRPWHQKKDVGNKGRTYIYIIIGTVSNKYTPSKNKGGPIN